jgi:hypothetical protein
MAERYVVIVHVGSHHASISGGTILRTKEQAQNYALARRAEKIKDVRYTVARVTELEEK